MDRTLIEAARSGDEEAFTSIARGSADRLLAVAYRILRDVGRSEDAVQQTLVTAWRQLPELREVDRFDAWIHRILIHACYAEAKRARLWSANVRVLSVDGPATPDTTLSVATRDALDRAFRRLPPEQCAVGMRFLPPSESVGVPPSESAPSESAAASSPSPGPSPIRSPIPLHSGPLVPGTYFIGPDLKGLWMECPAQPIPGCSNTMRLMFTVPDRWAGVGGNSIWPDLVQNFPPDGAGMLFTRGGWLRSDPCVPFSADASPGALVEVPGDIPVDS